MTQVNITKLKEIYQEAVKKDSRDFMKKLLKYPKMHQIYALNEF